MAVEAPAAATSFFTQTTQQCSQAVAACGKWASDVGTTLSETSSKISNWALPFFEKIQSFCQNNSKEIVVGLIVTACVALVITVAALVFVSLTKPAEADLPATANGGDPKVGGTHTPTRVSSPARPGSPVGTA